MRNIPKKHHGNISVLLPSRSAIRSLQRFDRGAVTSKTILLQQALQKLQPYIQQSGRRLKGQREGIDVVGAQRSLRNLLAELEDGEKIQPPLFKLCCCQDSAWVRVSDEDNKSNLDIAAFFQGPRNTPRTRYGAY
ncbi:uncharacterized protein WM294_013137 isoform 1-T2 [Sarcoramphus papa]